MMQHKYDHNNNVADYFYMYRVAKQWVNFSLLTSFEFKNQYA